MRKKPTNGNVVHRPELTGIFFGDIALEFSQVFTISRDGIGGGVPLTQVRQHLFNRLLHIFHRFLTRSQPPFLALSHDACAMHRPSAVLSSIGCLGSSVAADFWFGRIAADGFAASIAFTSSRARDLGSTFHCLGVSMFRVGSDSMCGSSSR